MANLRIVQSATTVNGDAITSTIQLGIVAGVPCALSLQGASVGSYAWVLGVPLGSNDELSSTTATSPTFTPTKAGNYFITLNGTYTLPINVTSSVPNVYQGPVVPAHLTPAQAPVPAQGVSVISDSTKPGSLLGTDANGNHAPIAMVRSGTTAQRPNGSTIGLFIGFPYFDTTIGITIWWNGTTWVVPNSSSISLIGDVIGLPGSTVVTSISGSGDVVDVKKTKLKWTQDGTIGSQNRHIEYQPTEAGAVAWIQGECEFVNAGSSRHNRVYSMGWNLAPGPGRAVGGGETAMGLGFETKYQPDNPGVVDYMEHHMYFVTSTDVQLRPMSWNFHRVTNRVAGGIFADRFDYGQRIGIPSSVIFQQNAVQYGDLLQVQILGGFNNAGFISQLNAAQNAYVEILRVNSANEVVIANGGGLTRVGGALATTTSITANATSGPKMVLQTALIDVNYGALHLGANPTANNPVVISDGSEVYLNAPGSVIRFAVAMGIKGTWDASGLRSGGTAVAGVLLNVGADSDTTNVNVRVNGKTSTSASAGSNGAPPGQVVGYLSVNVKGTEQKIPYYAV